MENELLSAEEKVLQHHLYIMNRSEIGSEEHTKALKGYMELKDSVIQSKRIEQYSVKRLHKYFIYDIIKISNIQYK